MVFGSTIQTKYFWGISPNVSVKKFLFFRQSSHMHIPWKFVYCLTYFISHLQTKLIQVGQDGFCMFCRWWKKSRVTVEMRHINSLAPGRFDFSLKINKFQTHFKDKYLKYFLWNCYQVNATTPHRSLVNIGSGNDLVPSGTKPLPEPMLTQFYVTIWRH